MDQVVGAEVASAFVSHQEGSGFESAGQLAPFSHSLFCVEFACSVWSSVSYRSPKTCRLGLPATKLPIGVNLCLLPC